MYVHDGMRPCQYMQGIQCKRELYESDKLKLTNVKKKNRKPDVPTVLRSHGAIPSDIALLDPWW